VRLPVFAILVLAAPLVRLALGAMGLLSLLAALFYEFFSSLPHPPFWSLLGFAMGCGLTHESRLRSWRSSGRRQKLAN
jgi:hypothetical protein